MCLMALSWFKRFCSLRSIVLYRPKWYKAIKITIQSLKWFVCMKLEEVVESYWQSQQLIAYRHSRKYGQIQNWQNRNTYAIRQNIHFLHGRVWAGKSCIFGFLETFCAKENNVLTLFITNSSKITYTQDITLHIFPFTASHIMLPKLISQLMSLIFCFIGKQSGFNSLL